MRESGVILKFAMVTFFALAGFACGNVTTITNSSLSSTAPTPTATPSLAPSASEVVLSMVGGSLSTRGTGKPTSAATTTCPNVLNSGNNCATSGANLWLTFNDCGFSGEFSWNGFQRVSVSNVTTAACGTFPTPTANATFVRQAASASGSTSAGKFYMANTTQTSYFEDYTTNLSNYDGQTLATIDSSAYGLKATMNSSAARASIQIGRRFVIDTVTNQTVYGTVTVNETSLSDTSRTVSGTLTDYWNNLKITGTTTLSNVVHSTTCCYPISGVFTTSYAAGANTTTPTTAGSAYVGKTEIMTITGCGTGSLQAVDGTTSDVTFQHCF